MSHGPATTTGVAEPNLVPLLDLVLQLIMFFMMCTQFVVLEQNDQTIRLPLAQQATPLPEKGLGPDVLYLGVSDRGAVKVFGRPRPLVTDEEILVFLRDVYESAKEAAARRGAKEVATQVVVRADKDATFEQIYRVLRRCQEVGLRKVQLRAIKPGG
jgi:biopolymer transport protein ExbD